MFKLDPRLKADGPNLEGLFEDHIVIQKLGSQYPWLVVVPMVPDAVEIFDLTHAQRDALFGVVSRVASALHDVTGADKINVECLGNMCAQLHVHIISRHKHDPAWPSPVWSKPFEAVDPPAYFAAQIKQALAAE